MIKFLNKNMSKLLVDIPESLHKRIKHQAIDEDISIKDLVIGILDDNIKDSKTKEQKNIEKIMGKKK